MVQWLRMLADLREDYLHGSSQTSVNPVMLSYDLCMQQAHL